MFTDAELLQRYVRDRDERAFTELVQRHLDLVYAAALRRTDGRRHLAGDISQSVFAQFARRAAVLQRHPALTAWLHRCTRNAAIDALRAEQRRQKLAQSLTAMPDNAPPLEPHVDWEHLRPVIDEALDQLKERDRELMLLRFFHGLTFAEVGARLDLAENTARMRTERALDQLRAHLGRRGVTSTSAALALLLAHQTLAAAPAGFAATVTATALAAAPTGGAAGLVSFLLMSKLTAPALSAVLAAGITAVIYTSLTQTVSADELAVLRAESARLTEATAPGANPAALASVADEYAAQANAIAHALAQRHPAPARTAATAHPSAARASASPARTAPTATTARGHHDRGQATARDAALTFAWAGDISDPDAIAKLIYFDGRGRDKALAVLASMPESIRARYRTPEELYGLFLAAATLQGPPPGADVMENSIVIVDLGPGRAAMRYKGSTQNYHEYQLTPEGWKWVLPEPLINIMPRNLNSETLARLSAGTPHP